MLIIGIDEMRTFARDKGVTLMELLTVIAIIGMMAAITLPAFHLMARGHKLNSSAKLITDTLSSARGLAITYRLSYWVELDCETTLSPERDRLRIYYMIGGGNPDSIAQADYDQRVTVGKWKKLPEPVVFFPDVDDGYKPPQERLKFKANGGIVGPNGNFPANFTIVESTTLEGPNPRSQEQLAKAKTCNIKLNNVTGRVKATFE